VFLNKQKIYIQNARIEKAYVILQLKNTKN
jgi:hypothetical protein